MGISARKKLMNERKNNNLSQEKAGILVGISQCYFSQLETGQKTPSMRLAKKIQRVFKIEMEGW